MLLSLDSETSGVDLRHGALPYLVTVCDEAGSLMFWEWDVDPLTRKSIIPESDIQDIRDLLEDPENQIVAQNVKFDSGALAAIGITEWPWSRTDDTLIAGHVLHSNEPHDLTSMVLKYCAVDIKPYEDALRDACVEARRVAKKYFPNWRLAKRGLEDMPSAKESVWKYDGWLPRALWKRGKGKRSWETVLSAYANMDSSSTLPLWQVQERELRRLDLWEHYAYRLRLPEIMSQMEGSGVTLSASRLEELKSEYVAEVDNASAVCRLVADEKGYELTLPKAGNNKSLVDFCFGPLALPVIKRTEKLNPSLDKEVIEEYKKILQAGTAQHRFIKALGGARKRTKSLEYLDSYLKFAVQLGGPEQDRRIQDILRLHSSINPTGTSTTRFSNSNPNLQQVSKLETQCEECLGEGCPECGGTGEDLHSVRRVFGPAWDREWWSLDAKNIELRIPAYESGETDLIALFEQPDAPPYYGSQHILNFSIVYEDLWLEELKAVGMEKVGPHCKKKYASGPYQYTKNGDFGLQYQCGEATADRAFRRSGAYRKLKSKFTRLNALNAKWVRFAEKTGYVETMPDRTLNSKRGYPLYCARGDYGKIVPTTPLNYHTQGTAGWWMLKSMIRCHDQLETWKAESGFSGFIALTVHDELVFDFPRGQGKEPWKTNLPRIRKIKRLMEQGGDDIGVPTPCGLEYHPDNWSKGLVLA